MVYLLEKIKKFNLSYVQAAYLALGIFIFIFFVVFIAYSWNYYNDDEFLKFSPNNVSLFVQIKEPIFFSRAFTLSDEKISEAYKTLDDVMGWDFNFKQDVLPFVDGALALVITEDKKNIVIFKARKGFAPEEVFKDYNIFWLSKNIVAVGSSDVDFKEVFKNISSNNLKGKLNNRFNGIGSVKIYADLALLKLNKNFEQLKDVVIVMNKINDFWQFNLNVSGNFDSNTLQDANENKIIDTLPDNYLLFVRNLSLAEIKNFNFFNNDISQNIFYENISPLISGSVELMVYQSSTQSELNYVLASSLKKAGDFNLFEENFNELVAYNWPQKIKRILPDGSSVNEIVASPENIIFEKKNNDFYYLNNKGYKIGYSFLNDKDFIIFNDQFYLLKDSNVQKQDVKKKVNKCWSEYPLKFILYHQDFGLGFNEIFIKINSEGSFSGCLY